MAYSYIGLQTVYLATYFPSVYWNTACLRVDAGLDEDSGSDYAKLARAVGNMVNSGIDVSAIDINKSGYLFEPDEENNRILFGLKALNGIGTDAIPEIINNRPYKSFEDFQERAKVNMPTMFALIKSGAFDRFEDRVEVMRRYVTQVSKPKSRITMQNFKALSEGGLLPRSLKFQRQVFNFDKTMKATCKIRKDVYALDKSDVHYRFFCKYFNTDKLSVENNHICLDAKTWKKMYDETMEDARDYIKRHGDELLVRLNESLFQEKWDKYASGGLAAWEMDAMGFYCHPHELANLDYDTYGIKRYSDLPYVPETDHTFKRGGKDISIPKTCRIAGTVVGKNNTKAQVDILTRDSGVVTVKFSLDYFAQYNRRITDMVGGVSKVVDEGWFQKGSLIVVNGYRSADIFKAKSYKKTNSHQLYKITSIAANGTIEMTNARYGEE